MLRLIIRSLAAALLVSAAAQAQTPVVVTNTASRPVPVSGQVQVTGSVGLTGAPAVTISGTPTVNVANQPAHGQPVFDSIQANGNAAGDVTGAPGSAVPAGKRRNVTMVSANMFCPVGKNAYAAVYTPTGQFFLPLQPLYVDTVLNKSVYVMALQTNFTMLPGNQAYALVHSDGSGCLLTVAFSGTEVPDLP